MAEHAASDGATLDYARWRYAQADPVRRVNRVGTAVAMTALVLCVAFADPSAIVVSAGTLSVWMLPGAVLQFAVSRTRRAPRSSIGRVRRPMR